MRTVRFLFPCRTCGKVSFLRLIIYPAMSFVSFLQEKKSFPSFLFRRKNGQLAREAQALRRTDAGISCVVVGRNTTAGMPPSSALSLPVSAAPARQLSRANRPCKRKSTAAELLFCSSAASANVLHKTDGSHTNRPFFRSEQDTRESVFSQINQLSRYVFCFFSSRKEIVPFQKKRNRSLSEEKNRPSITSTARRGSRQQPSCPRPLRGSRSQRRSQRLRPHTRTACSSCRSPHRQ